LVAPDRLRFDFSHPKSIDDAEILKVEDLANAVILENSPVVTRLMAFDEAAAVGARALFGERYGDVVRVVSMGQGGGNALGWSVELCGGTHVARTGDIGLVTIVSETGVAAGVRRIEALTATAARKHLTTESRALERVATQLRVPVAEVDDRLTQLLDDRKRLERELGEVKKKLAMGGGPNSSEGGIRIVGDVKLLARSVAGIDVKDLKSLVDEGKRQVGSGVVAVVGVTAEGKAGIVVGVTPDLTQRYNAVDLVRKGAEALGGKGGGGRPDMAQAGGPDGTRAQAALEAIEAGLLQAQ
jgi:alanyl-tRNA synthetase